MVVERTGEAFELEAQLTVIGSKLQPGQMAPDFALDYLNPSTSGIQTVNLTDTDGKVRLLNVVNSLDTPVCHVETHHWDDLQRDLPENVVIYTISMDLPYAQARWQVNEDTTHPVLSSHRSEDFGRNYGVLIKEWRLLQRAVMVIDRQNRIIYAEYLPDQMREPDYDAAMEAARQAAIS
ncbi:MAG: thiol peroxidase [Chloroflexi bacterium]|nr:thiol peroxidase [Chloroflexota bacterium]